MKSFIIVLLLFYFSAFKHLITLPPVKFTFIFSHFLSRTYVPKDGKSLKLFDQRVLVFYQINFGFL